jgi:amino acid adenylation domain-containing protein
MRLVSDGKSLAAEDATVSAQTGEDAGLCILPCLYRVYGHPNVAALDRALHELGYSCDSHSSDRKAPYSTQIVTIDLRSLPQDEREVRAREIAAEESLTLSDLRARNVFRGHLMRLSEEEYFLLITGYSDAWGGSRLELPLREFEQFYDAISAGEPVPDGGSPGSGAASFLAGTGQDRISHWKRKLAGRSNHLTLPFDRPHPPQCSFRGARESCSLPAPLAAAVASLGRIEGAAPSQVLLTAFVTLLNRYTSADDLVLGLGLSGGMHPAGRIIAAGPSLTPLRIDVSGDPSFRVLLKRVEAEVVEACDNRACPVELPEESSLPPVPGQHRLFQVLFEAQRLRQPALNLSGLRVEAVDFETGIADVDLALTVASGSDGLGCTLRYSTDLFDAGTIQRMLGHYRIILEGIVANPDRPISRLSLLASPELHRMLVEWNDTTTELPQLCVHRMFEQQVQRTPAAVALVLNDEALTYSELNARANRLARVLRARGVGPNAMVVLCMERSVDMVIGLLAILKAGGAYVGLDPTLPQQRLRFMIADAQAPVLLCRGKLKSKLPAGTASVLWAEDWDEIAAVQDDANLDGEVSLDDLAYMLYTSGSTGQPKGVLVSHRAIVRLLFGVDYATFGENEVLLHLAPLAFDASTLEIWGALLHGSRLVLYPGTVPAIEELGALLDREGVTTLWLTASLFNLVIDNAPQILRSVRQLLVGGEALSVKHIRRAQEVLPSTQLINGYGPTESTTFTTCYRIPRDLKDTVTSIPLGKPIGNTRVYVLDRNLQPVPIGVAGELHIAGDGLARGYHRQPEVTEQKFIPDPFRNQPGARLYKTGDLVRYQPDGNLEFLGRLDLQIKIRGYRIELTEIEAALTECAGVREAVVTAWDVSPGDRRLLAYVVYDPGAEVSDEQLTAGLRATLPEYMLPARYVALPEIPTTANGKVNRAALPRPTQVSSSPEPIEEASDALIPGLLRIWSEVLQRRDSGEKDDFFESGGNSILALDLVARVEKVYHTKVSVRAFFRMPTIQGLASLLRQPAEVTEARVVRVQPNGSRAPLLCVGGDWPVFRALARRLGTDQPFFGVPIPGPRELPPPYGLEEFASVCVKTIRAAQPEGPYCVAGWSDWGVLGYEIAQQLVAAGSEVALLALFDSESPTQLANLSPSQLTLGQLLARIEWLGFHARAIPRLTFREARKYVGTGLRNRMAALQNAMQAVKNLRRSGGARAQSDVEDAAQALQQAVVNYQPQPYARRTILFRAAQPPGHYRDPQSGWRELIGELEIHNVPGGHLDILLEPAVQIVADKLGSGLIAHNNMQVAGSLGWVSRRATQLAAGS